MGSDGVQVRELEVDGERYRLEVSGRVRRTAVLTLDGAEVARTNGMRERLTLTSTGVDAPWRSAAVLVDRAGRITRATVRLRHDRGERELAPVGDTRTVRAGRTPTAVQRYHLVVDGRSYAIEVSGRARRTVVLLLDGAEVARETSTDERITVTSSADDAPWRRLEVLLTRSGRVRRATIRVRRGNRELDLDPEPGSANARRLDRERAHPLRYAVLDVLLAAARVLLPLLGLAALFKALLVPYLDRLLALLPHPDLPDIRWPQIDLPDLPSIPWPSVPWPDVDLPDIPWPDWDAPPWVVFLLDNLDLIVPIVAAAVLARTEMTRRRKQDELKAQLADEERRRLLARLAGDLRAVEASPAAVVAALVAARATEPAPTEATQPATTSYEPFSDPLASWGSADVVSLMDSTGYPPRDPGVVPHLDHESGSLRATAPTTR